MDPIHYSSRKGEYHSPASIVQAAHDVLGGVDLDPCADAKRSVRARRNLTAEQDGLIWPWFGTVYLNPPYGREISLWTTRLTHFVELGHVPEAIALVPARTDTRWWEQCSAWALNVCFVHGRLRFGEEEHSAPFPSALFYFGTSPGSRRFALRFSAFGSIWSLTYPYTPTAIPMTQATAPKQTAHR